MQKGFKRRQVIAAAFERVSVRSNRKKNHPLHHICLHIFYKNFKIFSVYFE